MDAMKVGWRRYGASRLFVRKSTAFPKAMQPFIREVRSVETPIQHQRQGLATMLLRNVCAEADRAGMVLVLWPAPWGANESMNTEQLAEWYKKFGFEAIQSNPVLMARAAPNLTPKALYG